MSEMSTKQDKTELCAENASSPMESPSAQAEGTAPAGPEDLREAYGRMLREMNSLRNEYTSLLEKASKADASSQKLKEENARLKSQLAKEKARTEASLRQLEQLQRKYDALAQSKLGRLTLYHWAKQAKKKPGAKSLSTLPAVEKLFSRLPSADELESDLLETSEETAPAGVLAEEQTAGLEAWAHTYDDAIDAMPDSSGSRYYQRLSLRIGIICDEFFYESICDAAEFVYLTPDNWEALVEEGRIDLLLFVSAWRGLSQEWVGLATPGSKNCKMGLRLIQACQDRNIPAVFYAKEDPPNYERFLGYAKQCDYVFTSAAECVPYYMEDCGHDRVRAVMFGINPSFHNPIGFVQPEKEKTVLFSGSWMNKYPRRCRELSIIFGGILNSDHELHIVDRNYGNEKYQYPGSYRHLVSPAVEHARLQKLHKLFDWAVNVNSVTASDTMFANRTFELQAGGVLLLSNYSIGVNSVHPTVFMVHEALEADKILEGFSPEDLYEHQIAGIRSVMTGHTCYDRIAELLAPTGLDAAQPERRILVLTDTADDSVQASFDRQSYPLRELVRQSDLTEDLLSRFDMVTWFESGARYGEFYLEDMSNGFKFTACDYITKDAWYEGDELHEGAEHAYVGEMKDRCRTLFWRESFPADFFLSPPEAQPLPNGYSIDRFSYRKGEGEALSRTKPYVLSVIVPVYNNGAHLYGKCFSSLLRSSIFEDMEILLVDDGSTDRRTELVQSYLADRYPNVRRYAFRDGGSGSASRPRNKGVELASAEYVTFLDPDNEAICDGYAELLGTAREKDLDICFGNIYRCTDETQLFNYHYSIKKRAGKVFFEDGCRDELPGLGFLAVSIQAMVIRRSIITDNGLEQVPGAAGQDTLFCWQLLSAAKRVEVLDIPIHVYYAQTSGSVTNTVKPAFFEKIRLLQQPKIDWLEESGLLREYMDKRHDVYINGWLFKKLTKATDTETCARLLESILLMWQPYYHGTDETINAFMKKCGEGNYDQAYQLIFEAFPETRQRPMPTLEESMRTTQTHQLDVEYALSDRGCSLQNHSGEEGKDQYAWVILQDKKAYRKISGSEYSSGSTWTVDVRSIPSGNYKVRAFWIPAGGNKVSEDVLFFGVDEDRHMTVKELRTIAYRSRGEDSL